MKIFIEIPGLWFPSGGTKVGQQWVHILNSYNYDAYLMSPQGGIIPQLKNYNCNSCTFQQAMQICTEEDIMVFNFIPSVTSFSHIKAKKYFFSQGCYNFQEKSDWNIIKDLNLLTISDSSRLYYIYATNPITKIPFDKFSKVVNNWIDTSIFFPKEKQVGTVCTIKHNRYSIPNLVDQITSMGLRHIEVAGTEKDIAAGMSTAEYFISFSKGLSNGYISTEGFPLPMAEAMACGCIVIAHNCSGNLEFCMDKVNSFITTEREDLQLIQILEQIKEQSILKRKIAENAVWTISKKFNKEIIFQQIKHALNI